MDDNDDYYEVLYNDCYGGFDFPEEFDELVFNTYPPHTPEGLKLFRPKVDILVVKLGEKPEGNPNDYYEIVESAPMDNGYTKVKLRNYRYIQNKDSYDAWNRKPFSYATRDFKTYYPISIEKYRCRASKPLIEMVKAHGLIGIKIKYSKLAIEKIRNGYKYDIREYDGLESVEELFPYREVINQLVDCIKTKDESRLGPLAQRILEGKLKV